MVPWRTAIPRGSFSGYFYTTSRTFEVTQVGPIATSHYGKKRGINALGSGGSQPWRKTTPFLHLSSSLHLNICHRVQLCHLHRFHGLWLSAVIKNPQCPHFVATFITFFIKVKDLAVPGSCSVNQIITIWTCFMRVTSQHNCTNVSEMRVITISHWSTEQHIAFSSASKLTPHVDPFCQRAHYMRIPCDGDRFSDEIMWHSIEQPRQIEQPQSLKCILRVLSG